MRNNLKEMDSCFDILIPQQELSVSPTEESEGKKQLKKKKEEDEGDWRWAGLFSSSDEEEEGEEGEKGLDDDSVSWEGSEDWRDDRNTSLSARGLGNTSYELEVSVDKSFQGIEDKTDVDGNAALFETLRNCLSLLVHKHYDLIKDWVDILVHLDLPVRPTAEDAQGSYTNHFSE